jgi:hypothetical protein
VSSQPSDRDAADGLFSDAAAQSELKSGHGNLPPPAEEMRLPVHFEQCFGKCAVSPALFLIVNLPALRLLLRQFGAVAGIARDPVRRLRN